MQCHFEGEYYQLEIKLNDKTKSSLWFFNAQEKKIKPINRIIHKPIALL